MSKPIKIARAMLRGNVTVFGLLGSRAYPAGGVLQRTPRPYAVMSLTGIDKDEDLNGDVDGRSATVNLQIVGDTKADVSAVLAAFEDGAFDGLEGTYAGINVRDSQVADESITDVTDEPVDVDDGEAFVASLDLEILYD